MPEFAELIICLGWAPRWNGRYSGVITAYLILPIQQEGFFGVKTMGIMPTNHRQRQENARYCVIEELLLTKESKEKGFLQFDKKLKTHFYVNYCAECV